MKVYLIWTEDGRAAWLEAVFTDMGAAIDVAKQFVDEQGEDAWVTATSTDEHPMTGASTDIVWDSRDDNTDLETWQ